MKTVVVFLMSCLVTVAAHAADKPDITVADDGTIVARMMVDAPEADVRTVFPEIQAHGRFANVFEVNLTQDGSCSRVFRRTRGLFSPLELYTRLCPTAKGWREHLVQSDSYDAYDVEWSVQPKDGRTEVQLTVRSSVNLPVPNSLVRSGTIAGVNETFTEMLKRLFKKKDAR